MNCYCVFCRTEKAHELARLIEAQTGVRVIQPKRIRRLTMLGKRVDITEYFLPGYIFLYSDAPADLAGVIRGLPGFLRVLGSQQNGFALTGSDEAFAAFLMKRGGVIGDMKVRETDGRYALLEEGFTILKVDRKKTRLLMEFDFDGQKMQLWTGYDIV